MGQYFNYFTDVEDCFSRHRGTPTLLSPLDWALVESWKEAGIPLEAVLRGIERTFERFQKRPGRFRKINGLAYCSQSVLEVAEELKTASNEGGARKVGAASEATPFTPAEIRAYLQQNALALEAASLSARQNGAAAVASDLDECAAALRRLAEDPAQLADLELLENRLSALEEKMTASVTRGASVELLARLRAEVERELDSCRRKMTGLQIESFERQLVKKRLYEHYRIPRLSLFYL